MYVRMYVYNSSCKASRLPVVENKGTLQQKRHVPSQNMAHGCELVYMIDSAFAKFNHLLAAIIADALDVEKYDEIAKLLAKRAFHTLSDALCRKNALHVRYWVCAFSVNQHAGICATPPSVDSTGHAIAPCRCATPKHFDGDLSDAELHACCILEKYGSPGMSRYPRLLMLVTSP